MEIDKEVQEVLSEARYDADDELDTKILQDDAVSDGIIALEQLEDLIEKALDKNSVMFGIEPLLEIEQWIQQGKGLFDYLRENSMSKVPAEMLPDFFDSAARNMRSI